MVRLNSARLRGRPPSTPQHRLQSEEHEPCTAPSKLTTAEEVNPIPGAFPSIMSVHAEDAPLAHTQPRKERNTHASSNDKPEKRNIPSTPIPTEGDLLTHKRSHQKLSGDNGSIVYPSLEYMKSADVPMGTQMMSSTCHQSLSSPCQFGFRRDRSLDLSPEAKLLMHEKREEVARIREQMVSANTSSTAINSPNYAAPRHKGRFSDVHRVEFNKMESIASHVSANRALRIAKNDLATPKPMFGGRAAFGQNVLPKHSLKRTASIAGIDQSDSPQAPATRQKRHIKAPGVGRLQSRGQCETHLETHAPSVLQKKRIKLTSESEIRRENLNVPQTQETTTHVSLIPSGSTCLGTGTPFNVRSTSPARAVFGNDIKLQTETISRSRPPALQDERNTSLFQTPIKPTAPRHQGLYSCESNSRLLSLSPHKPSISIGKNASDSGASQQTPLLTRSPFKISIEDRVLPKYSDKEMHTTDLNLLKKPPVKSKPHRNELLDVKFPQSLKAKDESSVESSMLVRATPKKSILRTPQRLYSDDPAKIAAGTHLATPPRFGSNSKFNCVSEVNVTAQKHVDFSSSTKARYDRAQSEMGGDRVIHRSENEVHKIVDDDFSCTSPPPRCQPAEAQSIRNSAVSPNRRQTVVPMDFTFRAGTHEIVFGKPPQKENSWSPNKRCATIRQVSTAHMVPSRSTTKKRKFEYENNQARTDSTVKTNCGETSDKENVSEPDVDQRPAKRVRSDPHPVSPSPSQKGSYEQIVESRQVPTPRLRSHLVAKSTKGGMGRKPTTISQSRLNMLAQPKKRTYG